MTRVMMTKSLDPNQIPNGTRGKVIDGTDPSASGLHAVWFECGWAAYVYPHEVEILEEGP
jgi:hypothetical protein